jgi:hypothetical protein
MLLPVVLPLRFVLVGLTLAVVAASGQAAQPPAEDPALRSARRDVEMAQLRLRRYELVDFPLQLRKLDSRIKLLEAEQDVWRERVREYQQFDKWVGSNPVLITLADARLSLLQAETELDDARQERHVLQEQHQSDCRLLELEVEAAEDRLRALEPAVPRPPTPARRLRSAPSTKDKLTQRTSPR